MRRSDLPHLLLLVVAWLACVLRLADAPLHLHDIEDSWVGEVGYLVAHGGAGLLVEYQVDLYRGSGLVDGLLAALGSVALGDHFLAWRWVGLAYLLGILALLSGLLRRAGAERAALVFLGLMAAAPFVIQDGAVAMVGSHVSTLFWVLLSFAVLGSRRLAARWPRGPALLAGAVLGFAVWYTRTAAVFAPVLLYLAMRGGGWSRLRRVGLGLAAFPTLCLLQAAAVMGSSRAESGFQFSEVLRDIVWTIKRSSSSEAGPLAKVPDVFAVPFAERLFVLPRGDGWDTTLASVAEWAGRGWSLALILGVGGAVWAVRSAWGAGSGDRGSNGRWLAVLATLWVWPTLAYLLSGLRIEESVFLGNVLSAPSPTELRYVAGGLLLLLVSLAVGLSALSRRWPAAWLLVGLLVSPGLVLRVAQPRADDRPSWSEVRAFRGGTLFRVPTDEALAVARQMPSGYARATLVRTAGVTGMAGPLGLRDGPGVLRATDQALPTALTDEDRAWYFEGVGRRLGDLLTEDVPAAEVVVVVREGAALLGGESGAALWRGLGESPDGRSGWRFGEVGDLCVVAEPLCWTVAARALGDLDPLAMESGAQLLEQAGAQGVLGYRREQWLYGLGFAYGEYAPPRADETELTGWTPADAAAFKDGWRSGGRFRWRGGGGGW